MREIPLKNEEYYHIFNRGVDKRDVFLDNPDYFRFLKSLKEFNQIEPVVSLYILDQLRSKDPKAFEKTQEKDKLVDIIAYNLLSNHFHLIVKQVQDGGTSEFMRRIGNGYTRYFNYKYKRSGVLFQGKFNVAHIDSNEKLVYLSAYVNGNHIVHGIKDGGKSSSLAEYENGKKYLCDTNPVLNQFNLIRDYLKYMEKTTREIHDIREDIKKCLME